LFDQRAQVSLAEQVVRASAGVLELQRPILVFPAPLDRLEEHERISRTISQFVLRQIRRNRVDPRRELFRSVKPMNVAVDANENFLNQILGLLPIADRTVNEVQQSSLIPFDQLLERALLAAEEGTNH